MNLFIERLVRLLAQVLLLAIGLVVAVGLAFAALVLLGGWGLYALWARLTGRPVLPFAWRVDPRAGFGRFYRHATAEPQGSRTPRADAARGLAAARPPEVTDVEPRSPGR